MSTIRVFLSHASSEQTFPIGAESFAEEIERELQVILPEKEFKVFVDKTGIRSAEDWRLRILSEVKQAHIFLFTGTQAWFESRWCTRELKDFVRAGRGFQTGEIPIGRAIVRLKSQEVEFRKVPWSRRFNARYAEGLVATRQQSEALSGTAEALSADTIAREVVEVARGLSDLQPVRLPGLRESWTFLPVGQRLVAFAALAVAIGTGTYVIRNQVLDSREVRAMKGEFRAILRDQQSVNQDMRVGLNTLLPSGLPSRLPSLQASQGEEFSRQWGFAVQDIERYFRPLANCLQQQTCFPDKHEELCSLADKAINGHGEIFRFFNDGGGGRGFLFAMGGSRPIFEPNPGAIVHEPLFAYTPLFHQLACTDAKVAELGGVPRQLSCPDDLKFALSWAYTWQARATDGQIDQLQNQRELLRAIGEKLDEMDGANGIFIQFDQAILELKKTRQENRPDTDPTRLDNALDERIFRNMRSMQRLVEPMSQCIANALPGPPTNADDVALGSALLLDTFLNPEVSNRLSAVDAILNDRDRRDQASLVKLMHEIEQTDEAFMEQSNGNYLTCESLMANMFTDPGFRFRLRNRRDSENNMRILALSQDIVTTPIKGLRESCSRPGPVGEYPKAWSIRG